MRWRREKKWTISLQSASTQELRNLVRETGGPCINDEGINHYTNRLRGRLQKSLQPAVAYLNPSNHLAAGWLFDWLVGCWILHLALDLTSDAAPLLVSWRIMSVRPRQRSKLRTMQWRRNTDKYPVLVFDQALHSVSAMAELDKHTCIGDCISNPQNSYKTQVSILVWNETGRE